MTTPRWMKIPLLGIAEVDATSKESTKYAAQEEIQRLSRLNQDTWHGIRREHAWKEGAISGRETEKPRSYKA